MTGVAITSLSFAKRDKTAIWFVKGISHHQIHAAIQNSCHSAETVGLPGVKIYVWNLAGESTENTWQKVQEEGMVETARSTFFILSGELSIMLLRMFSILEAQS